MNELPKELPEALAHRCSEVVDIAAKHLWNILEQIIPDDDDLDPIIRKSMMASTLSLLVATHIMSNPRSKTRAGAVHYVDQYHEVLLKAINRFFDEKEKRS